MGLELEAGFELKQYTLDVLLGTGSAGEVWRATNGTHAVAIKFMNEKLLSRDDFDKHRQRLKYEINALLRLKRSFVPQVYDFDLDYARPYVVMQYIEGESYDHLIARGEMLKVPLQERFKAIGLVALTLTHAHHRGIIHRDIKPANIKGFDPPYLLDFGIALESQMVDQAQPDIGTGVYMPPAGEPLDKLSDIYSFALVVYEMLFNQHPLFTPASVGKTVMETRERAGDYLRSGAWRMPSRIPTSQLPEDLYAVDLTLLDALFAKSLGDRETRYDAFSPLLADLKVALESERAYPLELIPELPEESESMPVTVTNFYGPDAAAQLDAQTNYPPLEDEVHIPRKWLYLGVTAVILVSAVIGLFLLTR